MADQNNVKVIEKNAGPKIAYVSFGKLNEAPFIRLFMPVSKTLIIR